EEGDAVAELRAFLAEPHGGDGEAHVGVLLPHVRHQHRGQAQHEQEEAHHLAQLEALHAATFSMTRSLALRARGLRACSVSEGTAGLRVIFTRRRQLTPHAHTRKAGGQMQSFSNTARVSFTALSSTEW